ncbi:annexin-B12-like [Haliotis cracherodii]|uniref:annexin-B12-like n=1 Tax=Haliotis cracherodii TaxID=6455 RepID=UPI0039E74F8D
MSFFQSNYPSYGGGYGSAYPPSSGPPPPPGYGGGYQSAYNVNQYPLGGAFQLLGAVPGFTVPAVQQCAYNNQAMVQQAPVQMAQPMTNAVNNFDQHLQNWQMQQQQHMMDMMEERFRRLEEMQSKGEEISKEEEQEVEKAKAGDIKELMKTRFIDELMRREAVSGTFEMTEGTVKPFMTYPAEDPVVQYYNAERSTDLTDKPWDPEADCEYLRKGMKGLGTDEDAVTHVVATRCNQQRQKLKTMYKTMYGRDLIEDVHSELSGDYRESVMACFVDPARYDAWCVKEAIYGLGTDEATLIEVLMTRTNRQIAEMKNVYGDVASPNRKVSDTLIEKDIEDDTSGDFKRLLISASQGNRYEISRDSLEAAVEEVVVDDHATGMFQVNYTKLCDMEKARRDAQLLFKAGEDRWGTDEETFNRIFSTRDYYTMRTIYNEYVKITQRDILNSVDRETSGNFRKGLYAVAMNIRCRPMYFAEKLRDAMKGLGTADKTLIRIIISRSEIDMVQIKECFLQLTKQTLWNWLKDDCSGDYKKLLQAVVGRN